MAPSCARPRPRAPDLRLMLFDLPPVAERARARFAAAGLAGRAAAIGGDFLADPLPPGADVVSLVRVLHDHDDAAALAILRAARRALPAGRHAAAGRADGRHAGRRADRRRLFRLLPAGDGQRPAAHRRTSSAACWPRPGSAGRAWLPTRTPMLTRVIAGAALNMRRRYV